MKTLSDSGAQREIFSRLSVVSADDRARWGSMSAHQMICHLNDAYCFVLGERSGAMASSPLPRGLLKWMALRAPVRWPKGFPSPPEIAQGQGGTPPGDFDRDRTALLGAVREFCRGLPQPIVRHPYFGSMTEGDWRRWGYLHADHHLRQFGR